MDKIKNTRVTLDCMNIGRNLKTSVDSNGFNVEIFHLHDEPLSVNRIMISRNNLNVEILPSKGLTIGKTSLNHKLVLWDEPIGLPDPSSLNFKSDEISLWGKPSPGFTYLKSFAGGVEFLGLKNWGMPRIDKLTGEFFPLHGEVSNIPIKKIEFEINSKQLIAKGTFLYRTMEGDENALWWKRGEKMYKVTRSLIIDSETPGFVITDLITNISKESIVPDWGYHVTFWPEPGSKLLVPSNIVSVRGGGNLPDEFDTWSPAKNESIRTELGIIYKQLKISEFKGEPATRILKLYPDGRAFELIVPVSPYFQTWSSCGGSNSQEFAYRDGRPVFAKSWNGFGVEFGSSPLDNDGNTDKSVTNSRALKPNESKEIRLEIQLLGPPARDRLKNEIETFNHDRK
jgi:hypothetical protein